MPDSTTIRETAQRVMDRPYFQLEPASESGVDLWLLLWRFLKWLTHPLRAIFGALAEISPWLAWLVVLLLVVVLCAILAHIIYSLKLALDRQRGVRAIAIDAAERRRDPESFERDAQKWHDASEYDRAVRALFLACLLRLESKQRQPFRRGTTNREHLKRYRDTRLFEPLRFLVDLIDRTWYGKQTCIERDALQGRLAYASICRLLEEPSHAERA